MRIKLNEAAASKCKYNSNNTATLTINGVPGELTMSDDMVKYCIEKMQSRVEEALADPEIQETYGFTEEQLNKLLSRPDVLFASYFGVNVDIEDIINVLISGTFSADAEIEIIADNIQYYNI